MLYAMRLFNANNNVSTGLLNRNWLKGVGVARNDLK